MAWENITPGTLCVDILKLRITSPMFPGENGRLRGSDLRVMGREDGGLAYKKITTGCECQAKDAPFPLSHSLSFVDRPS